MGGCLQSVTADYRHPPIGKARQTIDTLILLGVLVSLRCGHGSVCTEVSFLTISIQFLVIIGYFLK